MRVYRRVAIHKRVLVNLTTGSAIEGVLYDDRGPLIILRDARLHNEGGSAPLDGEVLVERERIDFVQVVS